MSNLIDTTRSSGPSAVLAAVVIFATMPGVALAHSPTIGRRTPIGIVTDRDGGRPTRAATTIWRTLKERILEQIDRRLEALDRMSEAVGTKTNTSTKDHAKDLQDDYKDAKKIPRGRRQGTSRRPKHLAELQRDRAGGVRRTPSCSHCSGTEDAPRRRPRTLMVDGHRTALPFLAERTCQTIIDRRRSDNGQRHVGSTGGTRRDDCAWSHPSAADTAGPVADSVIGLDPSDWPDPAHRPPWRRARQTLEERPRARCGEARDNAPRGHKALIREIDGQRTRRPERVDRSRGATNARGRPQGAPLRYMELPGSICQPPKREARRGEVVRCGGRAHTQRALTLTVPPGARCVHLVDQTGPGRRSRCVGKVGVGHHALETHVGRVS